MAPATAVRNPVSKGKRGAVAVEFALVAPVLMILLFGAIEFGLAFKDLLVLNQAAREGARAASVGDTVSTVLSRIDSAASSLNYQQMTIALQRRYLVGGTWTSWCTLGDAASVNQNDATVGAQVRVRIIYPHTLATGQLFSRLATNADGVSFNLQSEMVMRRE